MRVQYRHIWSRGELIKAARIPARTAALQSRSGNETKRMLGCSEVPASVDPLRLWRAAVRSFAVPPPESHLLIVTPACDQPVSSEIDDAGFWAVSEIERDKHFAHVQVVNPGFPFAGDAFVVGLTKHLDYLVFGHPHLRILFRRLLFGLRRRIAGLRGTAGNDEGQSKDY